MKPSEKITIINQALALMSLDPIVSENEKKKRAEKVKLFYDSCLEEMLSRSDWNWARKKVKITHVSIPQGTIPETYKESCQAEYPYDYVHGIGLSCGDVGECCCLYNHQVNFRRINSNLEIDFLDCCCCANKHEYMVYIANSFDPAEWTPLFKTAFTYCLAFKCVEIFRSDLSKKQDLQNDYERYLQHAIKFDDKEGNTIKYPIRDNYRSNPFFKRCDRRFL